MSNANPRVIDLFCGCGGLSEGFEEAGFDIVSGIDIDKDMIRSYCENHPKSISICSDIGKVSCEELVANSGLKCADIELAFSPNVPQFHAKGQAAPQTNQQQGGGFDDDI